MRVIVIFGIGTDLVEIARIARLWEKNPQGFAERLLHPAELVELETKQNKEAFLAKRWAAKEAIGKALGTGIAQGVSFNSMQITHDAFGKPQVQLHGKTLELADSLGITSWKISISDEKHYAVVFVIAETTPT